MSLEIGRASIEVVTLYENNSLSDPANLAELRTMAGRRAAAKRGSGDTFNNDDDANQNQPAPLDVAAFVATITSAITTAVANAVAAPTPTPPQPASQRSISTAIDPFNTYSMNFDTRDRKSQWYKSTEAATN